MSEPKHTPGPWRINEYKPSSRRVFMPNDRIEILSKSGGHIASTYATNFSMDGERDLANAVLIASAPDLAQACIDVLSDCFILRDLSGITREHADFITLHLIKPLQAAIAKTQELVKP